VNTPPTSGQDQLELFAPSWRVAAATEMFSQLVGKLAVEPRGRVSPAQGGPRIGHGLIETFGEIVDTQLRAATGPEERPCASRELEESAPMRCRIFALVDADLRLLSNDSGPASPRLAAKGHLLAEGRRQDKALGLDSGGDNPGALSGWSGFPWLRWPVAQPCWLSSPPSRRPAARVLSLKGQYPAR